MKWRRVSLTMDSLRAEKLLWFFVFSAEDLQHDSLSGSVSEKSRQDKGSADQAQHQPSKSRYEKGDNDQDGSQDNSKNRLSSFYILHFRYGDPVHLPSNVSWC
jgi:hypothetical protein